MTAPAVPAATRAPDPRQQLGLDGEQCAVDALVAQGYAVLARRYRTRFGELDIVARDGDTLVFVEVKARRGVAFGQPEDAVTWQKRRRLGRLAKAYLAQSRLYDVPCRFDVVSVVCPDGGPAAVQVFRHAFDLEG